MGLISRVSSRTYRNFILSSTKSKPCKMAKSIDWTRLGWCMTQAVKVGSESTSMFANGKARFGAFKAASDQIMGKHTTAAARAKSINFDAYRTALPAQSAWIDSMEK